VKKSLDACSKAADASEAALERFTGPQAAYARAMGTRDALLVEWTRAFSKLKVNAKAIWHDDKATFGAVFAAPDAPDDSDQPFAALAALKKPG